MPEPDEGLKIRALPAGPPGTPLFSTWLERPYRHADALALRAELEALANHYVALPEPDGARGRRTALARM